jgi:ABC-2 type transport system ATP-binding protein
VIRASGLSKRFAGVTALDGVDLEARPGEVLGFLGPNGAGKTTTMRILAGFLLPNAGRVQVCDVDAAKDPLRARAHIGYLPEGAPAYPDMRIGEYLKFRGALKGVPRVERAARADQAAAECGLKGELRRMIGELSKGYRQRVGLADALLARPQVLILDEPTDGLDPNQRAETLELIKTLAKDRTVILSTHILPEVERICGRVVILDKGKVVAEGKPSDLVRPYASLRAEARGEKDPLLAAVRAIPGVERAEATVTDGIVTLRIDCTGDLREAIAESIHQIGKLRELAPTATGLEALFAKLTRPQ